MEQSIIDAKRLDGRKCTVVAIFATTMAAMGVLGGCRASGSSSASTTSRTLPISVEAHYVYVLNSASNNISAYSIDTQTGALVSVPGSPFPAGTQPEAITFSPSGAYAYTYNTASNDISGYSVSTSTGALTPINGSPFAIGLFNTPNTVVQPLVIDPYGRFAAVTNGGAPTSDVLPGVLKQTDNLILYAIDPASGTLRPTSGSPYTTGGFMPTQAIFDSSGQFLYVLNQFPDIGAEASSISAYKLDAANSTLLPLSGSPFRSTYQNGGLVSLTLEPAGKFAYINCPICGGGGFSIDSNTGGLTLLGSPPGVPVASGAFTRQSFVTTSSGEYVYGIAGTNVVSQRFDPATGVMVQINSVPIPTICPTGTQPNYAFAVDPLGKFVFVTCPAGNSVLAYEIDATTGGLAEIAGSPFPAGIQPNALAIDANGFLLVVTNGGSSDVSVFVVNRGSGALTAVTGSPFLAGSAPVAIALH